MPLHIDPDLGAAEKEPSRPDPLAHRANKLAAAAADALKSLEALLKRIQGEMEQPLHRKLFGPGQGRGIPLYGLLSIVFLACLYWEWTLSREIYEMWFPTVPWVPFFGCVGFALYASACLGESSKHFSLFLLDDGRTAAEIRDEEAEKTGKQLYGERPEPRKATNWFFHPLAGAAIALLFLFGIYLASSERINLLKEAGKRFIQANALSVGRSIVEVAREAGFAHQRPNHCEEGRQTLVLEDSLGRALVAKVVESDSGARIQLDLTGFGDGSCHGVMDRLLSGLAQKGVRRDGIEHRSHYLREGLIASESEHPRKKSQKSKPVSPDKERQEAEKRRRHHYGSHKQQIKP